ELGDAAERFGERALAVLGRSSPRSTLGLDHLLGGRAGREHLLVPGAVAVHRHALAAEAIGEAVDLLDVVLGRLVREVAGFGYRRIGELLERRLHADMPL